MTITQLAAFITSKLQKTDTQSVAFCKAALRVRWEIMWNAELWRQSIVDPFLIAVIAGTTTVIIPSTVDRVIALRFGARQTLDSANWESLLKDDPSFYERIGQPMKFIQAGRDVDKKVRIRLVNAPSKDDNLLVLGKAPFPACALDTDSPSDFLDGVDGPLLAFGEGDMLERQERRGTAQTKFTEATTLMKLMDKLQDEQSGQSYEMAPSPVMLNETDW